MIFKEVCGFLTPLLCLLILPSEKAVNGVAMKINSISPDDYIAQLSPDRRDTILKLREVILHHLPTGFQETLSYGMIGYVVPHALYPAGYHCDPKLPLPFMSIASQKNFVALYHMGIYAQPELLKWFTDEYAKVAKAKLDMGKSCIRFKKPEHIPFDLIGQLSSKLTVHQWIDIYESNFKKA